jgi:hypothetical protein
MDDAPPGLVAGQPTERLAPVPANTSHGVVLPKQNGRSGGHGDFVHLIREVSGAFVNSLDGLRAWCFRQAEHVPRLGVSPGLFEIDAFVVLDV